ncbi:hypothetical protein [Spongiibacter sp.]|uniref:hypothetical protein n=1 Tax=Spongiibacter sp. TaxID=2024860 RepID=UPI000C505258|nr:hypothetical protein [Spongiibacter sp.]MBU71728.1 hypothetical protein [Spongiibacter sp.]
MAIYSARVLTLGVNASDPALPDISEFIRYVPSDDLLEFWAANIGLGLSDTDPVATWTGVNGTTATQTDSGKRPTFDEDGIASGYPAVGGDGTDDILTTSIAPPAAGVICVGLKTPASLSGVKVVVGSYGGSATSALAIGFNGTELAGQAGDQNFTTLKGGALSVSTAYVCTLTWDASNCYLRLNGTQVATAAWGGSLGSALLGILGRNSGSPNYNTLAKVGAVAIYDAIKSGTDLDAIEDGVANAIGISI